MADGRSNLARGGSRHTGALQRVEKPGGNIGGLQCRFLGQRLAFARTTAQHRVDEADMPRRAPVGLRQPHGQVDGGMIGHVHPQDLRCAEHQRGLRALRIRRHAAIEQARQHEAQGSKPAQHGRDQPPHQRAVAVAQRLDRRMRGCAIQLVVQRAVAQENVVDDVRSDAARRESRRVGLRDKWWTA